MRTDPLAPDVARTPPRDVVVPLMYQRWDTVAFIHWRYDQAVVQRVIPEPLEVEEFDGSAWVSLTPFIVCNAHAPGLPPLPSMRRYGEANLRTYVRAPNGKRGIWFMALDSNNLPACALGRGVYFQPYVWSTLTAESSRDGTRYTCRRRWPHTGSSYNAAIETVGDPVTGGREELDVFLTGRWILFTFFGPPLALAPVAHEPWPLQSARVEISQDVTQAAGLPPPSSEPIAHFSPGVDAKLGAPRRA